MELDGQIVYWYVLLTNMDMGSMIRMEGKWVWDR